MRLFNKLYRNKIKQDYVKDINVISNIFGLIVSNRSVDNIWMQ